ncbi:hypothetical protein SPRG_20732 [Saprolegnia parasitica CBS 223.65]|uniref:PH domain-containing protein n=2 Tax=Saprolegnia parasitica (strain CBS 223.65) TaxID=695850 RepID=A0A067CEU0_SAPPC|nr:hypothetical protein SPRG_20732 [Saprolegnia parasitica CBS 223.65]KDO25332.1 hypothetical protein SPRG_20732 [Saprolegnia parasitica CBS 223.65]|eukprot:XP_012204023.1 hypothetical protein SPRG_20732 [Saprolegnia parasitica CBS 223.65]
MEETTAKVPRDDASVYQTDELRGYLLKKTRNGKWQKRWFETNGCFLTYYKKQGQKLLAALNLPQVGEIALLPETAEDGPGLFTIELNDRIYTIKAKGQDDAALWVEALVWRQQGGVVASSTTAMTSMTAPDSPPPPAKPSQFPKEKKLDDVDTAKSPGCAKCCVVQ